MKGEGMDAREALHNAYHESKDAGAASVADLTAGMIRSLAGQGYVLVNVAELRATIAAWRDPGDTPYEAGWNRAIDAVLALLDEK